MNVAKITQTKPTPFQNGVQKVANGIDLNINICQAKGLDINKTQGNFIAQSHQKIYTICNPCAININMM